MLDKLFQPIFENGFTAGGYLICTLASLLLGAAVAWAAVRKSAYTKGFVLTLVLIPAVVQTVIMLVNGPSDSASGALDCESGPLISGGVVMAVGASGMAVSFSDSSAQGSIQANVSAQPGGGRLYLCGEDGKVLCSMDTEKAYNSVIVSCPELEAGKTYVLCVGDGAAPAIADGENALSGESAEIIARVEMASLHYSDSNGGGMGGGFKGGGMGKMNPGAGKPGGF